MNPVASFRSVNLHLAYVNSHATPELRFFMEEEAGMPISARIRGEQDGGGEEYYPHAQYPTGPGREWSLSQIHKSFDTARDEHLMIAQSRICVRTSVVTVPAVFCPRLVVHFAGVERILRRLQKIFSLHPVHPVKIFDWRTACYLAGRDLQNCFGRSGTSEEANINLGNLDKIPTCL